METLTALKKEYREILFLMRDEGLLDIHYEHMRSLEETTKNPGLVSNLVMSFFSKMERRLPQMALHLDKGMTDKNGLNILLYNVKGGASQIGVCGVTRACEDLAKAMENNNNDRAKRALHMMTNEFTKVRGNLQTLVELDAKIHACKMRIQAQESLTASVNSSRNV